MIKTLGQAIRERRIELGLTQEQLAERIGDSVRQSEISRLERDHITLPRRSRLELIAGALDLPVGVLLAHSGWAGAEAIDTTPVDADASDPGNLKAANSDLEIRNLELQATVEELLTTNEDLEARAETMESRLERDATVLDSLQTIFDGIEDGIIVVNGEGDTVFQNARYLDLLARHAREFRVVDEEGRPLAGADDPLRRAADGQEFTMSVIFAGSGLRTSYVAHGKPMTTEYGETLGVVTIQDCADPE